jgi:hypothetical protein
MKGAKIVFQGAGQVPKKPKRKDVECAAEKLTDLAVAYLEKLSPAERERRIAAFEARVSETTSPKACAIPERPAQTQACHLATRGRGE